MNDRTLASVSDTPDTLPLFSSCFRLRLRVPLSRAAVLCGIETLASDVAVDCVTLVGMGHWRSGGAVIAEPVAVVEALCPTEAKAGHLLRESAAMLIAAGKQVVFATLETVPAVFVTGWRPVRNAPSGASGGACRP